MQMTSMGGSSCASRGGACSRRGPISCVGEQRSLNIGSHNTFHLSHWVSTEACPSQVTCILFAGGFASASCEGFRTGSSRLISSGDITGLAGHVLLHFHMVPRPGNSTSESGNCFKSWMNRPSGPRLLFGRAGILSHRTRAEICAGGSSSGGCHRATPHSHSTAHGRAPRMSACASAGASGFRGTQRTHRRPQAPRDLLPRFCRC